MSKPPFSRPGHPSSKLASTGIAQKRSQMSGQSAAAPQFTPPPISWPGTQARPLTVQQHPAPSLPGSGRLAASTPGHMAAQAKPAAPKGVFNSRSVRFPPPSSNIIQPMYSEDYVYDYYDDEEEEEEEDISYGDDAEYVQEEEEIDPYEFIGISQSSRPGPYSSVFSSVYSGGGYLTKTITNSMGTKNFLCKAFPCKNKKHGKNCDGFVYVVKGSNFSPTTPVRKKVKTKYTTKLQKPPICHIVDWVIIKEALGIHCGLTGKLSSEFEKFLCWGNLDNLTSGRMTCNSKSNAGQLKYTDLSSTRQKEIMSYVESMVSRQINGNATVGRYGSI